MKQKTDYREEFLKKCIVLDTETTSLDFKIAEVVEFGFVIKYPEGWVLFNELHTPVNTRITPEVSAITNITPKMVEGKIPFGEAIDELNELIDTIQEEGSLVAHNAFYDKSVLDKYESVRKPVNPWICTMRMAKKLYSTDESVTQYNLPYLRYRFELNVPETLPAHRASADAYVCAMLLEHMITELENRKLIDKNKPYKKQIDKWLDGPIAVSRMPFGKYKGTKLEEIPGDYWKWAIANLRALDSTNEEYDADLTYTVETLIDENKIKLS